MQHVISWPRSPPGPPPRSICAIRFHWSSNFDAASKLQSDALTNRPGFVGHLLALSKSRIDYAPLRLLRRFQIERVSLEIEATAVLYRRRVVFVLAVPSFHACTQKIKEPIDPCITCQRRRLIIPRFIFQQATPSYK